MIETIDAHVAGAAVRLVTSGLPEIRGGSLAERGESLMKSTGASLMALCREPRGHSGTIVAALAEPDRGEADAGLLLVSGDGVVALSGEGVIGALALALERGMLLPRHGDRVELDTLAGPVSARRRGTDRGGVRLSYTTSPASVLRANQILTAAGRAVHADLVWAGGEAIAIVDAEAAGAPLVTSRLFALQRIGVDLLDALDSSVRLAGPESGMALSVSTVVFIGAPPERGADVLSGTVHREGRVERSPGGSATMAVATVLSAMGVLAPGQRLVHQGLAGTTVGAEIIAIESRDDRVLVMVEVDAEVWPTGEHRFEHAPADPLRDGVTFV